MYPEMNDGSTVYLGQRLPNRERDEDSLLTPEDVARKFQVQVSWVYGSIRGRSKDKLPHIYIGRYPRFEESAVREFLSRKKRCYPAAKFVAGN
jgi:predicted DNA-binding transcriptional regulator AlpA